MNRFFALDVETANPAFDSICQVGLVEFRDSSVAGEWSWLVDPEDDFDDFNTALHGIGPTDVRGAPTICDLLPELADKIGSAIVVHHTFFDRTSVRQACARYELTPPHWSWLDSACAARRTWPHCADGGYGLAALAEWLGITFRHHDAREDARAAGLIMLAAMRETGLTLAEWPARLAKPISGERERSVARAGSDEGPLAGERVVFTGELNIHRAEAADVAASLGAAVDDRVTKHTTMLVVGDQDIRRLAGHDRSGKQRDAEKWMAKGKPIRILRECDFAALYAAE